MKDVKLEQNFESGMFISGDEERLRRAVVNLLTNAMQALETSAQPEKKVLLEARKVDGRVELVVENNGPAIPADLREKIYEPLFSTKSFGVGLGMAIVKDIVELHQGSIRLEEPDGGGCRFVLSFPSSCNSNAGEKDA